MIRRFLLSCFILVVTGTLAMAKDVRFVQVAEAMYTKDKSAKLEKCIEDINTLKKIDFVVFTGDNIAVAKKENLKGFLKLVRRLDAPVYLVIGDKDVSKSKGLNKEVYREEAFKMLGWGQSLDSNYVFKKKNLVFIVVDGAREFVPSGNGYYKQDTLDWLDSQLTKYKDKQVVLIQHFPLIDGPVIERNAYKIQLYRDLLARHSNVLAVVSGHYNNQLEISEYGFLNIVTPSYSQTNDYKIFDIPENRDFVYTQLRTVE